jgi:hypothetical protein
MEFDSGTLQSLNDDLTAAAAAYCALAMSVFGGGMPVTVVQYEELDAASARFHDTAIAIDEYVKPHMLEALQITSVPEE